MNSFNYIANKYKTSIGFRLLYHILVSIVLGITITIGEAPIPIMIMAIAALWVNLAAVSLIAILWYKLGKNK